MKKAYANRKVFIQPNCIKLLDKGQAITGGSPAVVHAADA